MSLIVEFIGVTGSGKSTLAHKVEKHLQRSGIQCALVDVGGQYWYDLLAIPWFMGQCFCNPSPSRLAYAAICQLSEPSACKFNLFRNYAKKNGTYAYLKKGKRREQIIILDEGTLHAIHNIFIDSSSKVDIPSLLKFAQLVPLPDICIYVRSPRDKVIHRTICRGHKRIRREEDVSSFVDNAICAFEELVACERIRPHVFIVDNDGDNLVGVEHIAESTCEFIRNNLFSYTPREG